MQRKSLKRDFYIDGENLRALPVEIKLSRTPTAALASGLTRYASLFAQADPEDGLLLCLADGERPISRGVTAMGVEEYLRLLQQRLAI